MTQQETINTLIHLGDNYINRGIPVGALSDDMKAKYHTALHAMKTGQFSEEGRPQENKGKEKEDAEEIS